MGFRVWWLEEKKSGFGGDLAGFGGGWVLWVSGGVAVLVVICAVVWAILGFWQRLWLVSLIGFFFFFSAVVYYRSYIILSCLYYFIKLK